MTSAVFSPGRDSKVQAPKIRGQFGKLGLSEQQCKWELACDIQGFWNRWFAGQGKEVQQTQGSGWMLYASRGKDDADTSPRGAGTWTAATEPAAVRPQLPLPPTVLGPVAL